MHTHTISAFAFAVVDAGYLIGRRCDIAAGVAVLTCQVANGHVDFRLEAKVLRPSDPLTELLVWIDENLPDDRTVLAGYRLGDTVRRLRAMPHAQLCWALRCLAGRGNHDTIDLSERDTEGRLLAFREACAQLGVPCGSKPPSDRFAAWCIGDTDGIAHDLHLDTLATLRLVLQRIAERTALGREVAPAIERAFIAWLPAAGFAAAQVHLNDLQQRAR